MITDLEFAALRAYDAAREPWGGATVHLESAQLVRDGVAAYAVADHTLGETITLDANVSWPEFAGAFALAAETFGGAPFVGVFNDADFEVIQLDPVRVVRSAAEADEIYSPSATSGGVYDFSTGLAYRPSGYGLAA